MKIIISHDVDYLTFSEHIRDLTIPKYIARNVIELIIGYISASEFSGRFQNLFSNKFQNTCELLAFDRSRGIPATVFIAVNRGRNGLNYSLRSASTWIKKIRHWGFDTGVHGIEFDSYIKIKSEKDCFESILGDSVHGIRMHYLTTIPETYHFLESAGYRYDSTDIGAKKNPYRIGKMWEFPIHLMDSFLINNGRPWQSVTLQIAQAKTRDLVDEALSSGIQYFTILFHDNHFCDAFMTWKKWYIWMIDYLRHRGFEFVSYKQAITELEGSSLHHSQ